MATATPSYVVNIFMLFKVNFLKITSDKYLRVM